MKILSIDAETDGLWGRPFSIAAIVYENEEEVSRFVSRLPNSAVKNNWVIENVLPTLDNIEVTHNSYEDMIKDFSDFYKSHKQDAKCICHMGYVVEAFLFREMHRLRAIGDFDAPYPLIDISGHLEMVGEDSTSVDAYAKKHGIKISDYGTTHNPLYDCEVAARVYFHILKNPQ